MVNQLFLIMGNFELNFKKPKKQHTIGTRNEFIPIRLDSKSISIRNPTKKPNIISNVPSVKKTVL